MIRNIELEPIAANFVCLVEKLVIYKEIEIEAIKNLVLESEFTNWYTYKIETFMKG